jgi:hypothetical protein
VNGEMNKRERLEAVFNLKEPISFLSTLMSWRKPSMIWLQLEGITTQTELMRLKLQSLIANNIKKKGL